MRSDLTPALISLLSVLGIWVLLFWLYRDYAIDRFRQDMFSLRDELFDAVDDGLLTSFDDPAYGVLRSTMNGFIRFAHRLSLLQLILLGPPRDVEEASVVREGTFSQRWSEAVATLDDGQRRKLDEFQYRMNVLVLQHLVRKSPIFALIAGWIALRFCLSRVVLLLRSPLGHIDSAALAMGQ